MQLKHSSRAIQRIEAELWPVFNFCTTLATHIAEWRVTVRLRRSLGWGYVSAVLCLSDEYEVRKGEEETRCRH